MNEYAVAFTVDFVVYINADSDLEADIISEDPVWRDDILDNAGAWDDVYVTTDVEPVEEL